jgi:hypothetical protein
MEQSGGVDVIESLPIPPPRTADPRRLTENDRVRDVARLEVRDRSRGERSVASALQRTYTAGQQLLLDRTELLIRDAQQHFAVVAKGVLLTGIGALVAAVGWLALMSASVLWLRTWCSLPESIAAVAGANLAIACVLVWRGSRAIGSGE